MKNKVRSTAPGRRGLLAMGFAAVVAWIVPVPHAQGGAACMGRYTISGGTVRDNDTKLTWQQDVAPGSYFWDANASPGSAQEYCNNLQLAGGGWRLPTVFELQTIVDESKFNPAIDSTAFLNTLGVLFFWSSSAYAGNPGSVWLVDFYDGYVYAAAMGGTASVRCVR